MVMHSYNQRSQKDHFMYSISPSQIHPSTGVSHCASAYFTHVEPRTQAQEDVHPNLILARNNLLQIFVLRCELGTIVISQDILTPCKTFCNLMHATGPRRKDEDKPDSSWLALVAEYRLWGSVESLAVLRSRAAGRQRDAVLLAFRHGPHTAQTGQNS
jgi:hypothetical protein